MSIGPDSILNLGELPFQLGHRRVPSNTPFPDVLPFSVGTDERIGMLVQMPNTEVSRLLRDAYGLTSILGTPMDDTPLGKGYAEDFLQFLCSLPGVDFAAHPRVLEIGCGTGYLLHRIGLLGGEVVGIEPGREGQVGAAKYGLPICRGMFDRSTALRLGKFDLVITYAVLEHVQCLDVFVRLQIEALADGGIVVAAVPDESRYYDCADVSMFVHEHWSYFTDSSLRFLLEAQGLQLLDLRRARHGGSLYAAARVGNQYRQTVTTNAPRLGGGLMTSQVVRFREYLEDATRRKRSVGLYCPSRALNLLYLAAPTNVPRFFDDDERLHGMFYPPFRVAIESREDLFNTPVDELLIMSRTFGKPLTWQLGRHASMQATSIFIPDDVLSGGHSES